ncbi:hypothetical protein RRG08_039947 [Elysia crispata]|uniref:Uncharacterized protein n=1 Tax=Elysia crispata TaxID=231223 RepID=A0AAE0Z985_9GAST|nr:hypothetical protein RRG08_039947 [Elysia crispata]
MRMLATSARHTSGVIAAGMSVPGGPLQLDQFCGFKWVWQSVKTEVPVIQPPSHEILIPPNPPLSHPSLSSISTSLHVTSLRSAKPLLIQPRVTYVKDLINDECDDQSMTTGAHPCHIGHRTYLRKLLSVGASPTAQRGYRQLLHRCMGENTLSRYYLSSQDGTVLSS